MVKKCDACKGKKIMHSVGCMKTPCHYCKGIGYVEKDKDSLISNETMAVLDKVIKKRKYIKKNINPELLTAHESPTFSTDNNQLVNFRTTQIGTLK